MEIKMANKQTSEKLLALLIEARDQIAKDHPDHCDISDTALPQHYLITKIDTALKDSIPETA